MSSEQQPELNKSCGICEQKIGLFTCRGCGKHFCATHTMEHRNTIDTSIKEIDDNCDELKKDVDAQFTEEYQNSLLERIDQWEHDSIEKIRSVAEETRRQIVDGFRHRKSNLHEKLNELSEELDNARQNDTFCQHHVQEWLEKLDQLKHIIDIQRDIKIDKDNDLDAFISKLPVNLASRDSKKESDLSVSSDLNGDEGMFNGINKHNAQHYSSGKYLVRIFMDYYSNECDALFGIISKTEFDQSPTCTHSTFYGWGSGNIVYLAGERHQDYQGYQNQFEAKDEYELIIDCKRQKIRLKNEKKNLLYELDVDLEKCPFPWQPHGHVYKNVQ